MTELSVDNIGSTIVRHQRVARFADTTTDKWVERLKLLIDSQPGIDCAAISNVREVGTAAGGSNGTLLFEATWVENGEPKSRGLVLRFLPTRGLFHVYDVKAQFNLQHALEATAVPVPPQLWIDEAGEILGRPGYVMAQVEGVSTPMTWMTSGIIADAAPSERHEMQEEYLAALAKLHAVDWRGLGLDWLQGRAAGSNPIEREINWYWDSLLATDNKPYIAAISPVRDWLIANEPDDVDIVLCHGDANFGNYLYKGTKVSAVVDWEMAFLGTPECDVTYLGSADQIIQADVPVLEGTMDEAERFAVYERLSGRKLKNLPYFKLFSAYRMAVMNILSFRHFPEEILLDLLPIVERGPRIMRDAAAEFGVICDLPPSGTIG